MAAQMRAVEAAALWYPAGARHFNKQYQTLARQFRAVTGPGWRGGSYKRMFDGRERCVELGPRDELVVRWYSARR